MKILTECVHIRMIFSFLYIILFLPILSIRNTYAMSAEEKLSLSEQSKEMFYHAYNSYMLNAFPADELMPLSCKGRYRDQGPSLNDINDTFGNFSLTLIDSLDTLLIIGDIKEFENAIRLVIDSVSFDADIVVTTFETNIRVVGGLISAHVLAKTVQELQNNKQSKLLNWYNDELLNMAVDVGNRLLPAFNSRSGLPHRRINLKYGMNSNDLLNFQETCTACAGSMILEFMALSRLSGSSEFEKKANRAMDVIWDARNPNTNLVGSVINVETGGWVKKEASIGGGTDSYYEYLAKGYLLTNDSNYLNRWNAHYSAIMNFIGKNPTMISANMDDTSKQSLPYIDALVAFWPGTQVLMGDLKSAIVYHQILYHIVRRYGFIPEMFRENMQVYSGEYRLRPEFIESTYYLYKATKDPYYLNVGKHVLRSLETHARVKCGFAALKDIREDPMPKQDRMDSFFLSETLKYLYLLFTDDANLIIDLEQFIFTTEGHLIPKQLSLFNRTSFINHV